MAALSVHMLRDTIDHSVQAIAFAHKHREQNESDYYKQFRTASMQSFEYSYDLAIKLIRRYVEAADPSAEENRHLNFRDYMRIAAEYGLISDPEMWSEFREWRNHTSHAYDQDVAQELFDTLPDIVIALRHTCAQVEKTRYAS